MTHGQTDAFLSGMGIEVDPIAIEQTLIDLWGPAAERVGGPEVENPPVTRVVLANLIVETTPAACERVARALDTIVARFPCRVIVAVRTDRPGRKITAEVAALCHLPAPGLPQVCSERIVLNAGPDAIDLLPGAIRPLLEPDLPVVLWWVGNPRSAENLFIDLAGESTRVLLDLDESESGALAFGLDSEINSYARDTAWFAITPWRELIAQRFDGSCRNGSLDRVVAIEVVAEARTAEKTMPRPAVWLVAWLGGQLGWTLESVQQNGDDPDVVLQSRTGPVVVRLRREIRAEVEEPSVVEVAITERDEHGDSIFSIRREPRTASCVRVSVSSTHTCEMPRFVGLPPADVARKVSAGLESSRQDPPFQRALPLALALLDSHI